MRRSYSGLLVLAAAAACTPQKATYHASVLLPRPTAVASRHHAMAPGVQRELLPDQQITHALNRLGYGPRPGDVEHVRSMGVDKWIALQLSPEKIDDARVDELIGGYETFRVSTGDLIDAFQRTRQARRRQLAVMSAAGDSASRREARREAIERDPDLQALARRAQRAVGDVQSAKLARAVASERQLQEVMVDFWENHFSVFSGKGQTRLFLASYDRDVIRPHALGKFRELLGAVAKSPAMLFFLDNWQSAADSLHPTLGSVGRPRVVPRMGRRARPSPGRPVPPQAIRPDQRRRRGLNENYARELMELHTLGVDGGYSQHDVVEVARALTGWSIDLREGRFVFRPQMHDAGEKVVLGQRLAAGRGIEDGEQVLDIVARHPATARFVTTKLVRRFVSDSAPATLVDRCARTFTTSDGDIRETVRCIVTSPEFFSRAAYRAKVKSPFEVVASALRAVNAAPDTTPRTAQIVARLGQPIFGRQTPDGWPDRADAWMNTGAILNRINFGLVLASGRIPGASLARWPDASRLRTATRSAQVDGVISSLLGGEVSTDTRRVLMSGENPLLSSRAAADSARVLSIPSSDDEPTMGGEMRRARPLERPVTLTGLAQVVGLALGAPEFQRR